MKRLARPIPVAPVARVVRIALGRATAPELQSAARALNLTEYGSALRLAPVQRRQLASIIGRMGYRSISVDLSHRMWDVADAVPTGACVLYKVAEPDHDPIGSFTRMSYHALLRDVATNCDKPVAVLAEIDQWLQPPVCDHVYDVLRSPGGEDFTSLSEEDQRTFLLLAAEALYGDHYDSDLLDEAVITAEEPI